MGDFLSVNLTGDRKLLRNFEGLPDVTREVLRQKIRQWTEMMRDAVVQNIIDRLSKTDRSKSYSGSARHLRDSVEMEITDDGIRVNGRVYIAGMPYAQAQESGAQTPPHVILPRNAKVLAFYAATGHKVFAARVFHPGATIPPSWFMRDAYRKISPKITDGLYYYVVRKMRDQLRK